MLVIYFGGELLSVACTRRGPNGARGRNVAALHTELSVLWNVLVRYVQNGARECS